MSNSSRSTPGFRGRRVLGHALPVLCVLSSAGTPAISGAQEPEPAATDPAPLAEIAVTATRISRSGFTAPTPTTTLGSEDRELRASTTVANLLNELPSIRPTAPALTSQ